MLFVLLPLPSSRTERLLPLSVSCTAPSSPLVPTITPKNFYNTITYSIKKLLWQQNQENDLGSEV
jgi:hypothetical protein